MSIITQDIVFTESAIAKMHAILAQEQNDNVLFRIRVEGGGCSGFQYKFGIDENVDDDEDDADIEDDDDLFDDEEDSDDEYVVQDNNHVSIAIVDSKSFSYLKNCTIDYVENLTKSDFVIRNPKATAKCGCGNSFAI